MRIMPDNSKISYSGRIDWRNPEEPVFVYPCTSAGIRFTGNSLRICVRNKSAYWDNYLGCIADGKQYSILLPQNGTASFDIVLQPSKDNEHNVLFFKRQDACHEMSVLWFETDEGSRLLPPPGNPARKIEVQG